MTMPLKARLFFASLQRYVKVVLILNSIVSVASFLYAAPQLVFTLTNRDKVTLFMNRINTMVTADTIVSPLKVEIGSQKEEGK